MPTHVILYNFSIQVYCQPRDYKLNAQLHTNDASTASNWSYTVYYSKGRSFSRTNCMSNVQSYIDDYKVGIADSKNALGSGRKA